MQRGNVAAISVAAAKDGKILWEEGFGWANRERMIPATANTMFSLASISKPITATGLMILVERGQVALDRPINDYLGITKLTGLAGDARGATVARVLSHTAGLPLHYQFFYAGDPIQPPTMDETIARYGNLVSAPGETFRYSNLGYGIIDYVISRVSRRSYADFMRNEVFLPLGMTRTSVDVPAGMADGAAERYDLHQRPVPFYRFDHAGASAVYSSAHDLIRFGMFHLKNRLPEQRAILSDSSLDRMKAPLTLNAFGAAAYGLGWIITQDDHGYLLVEHSGGMPGVATELKLYPTENLAVTVLTDGAFANPGAIADEITGVVLPKYGKALADERASPAKPEERKPFVAPAQLVGTWKGTLRTWRKTVPFSLTIEQDGDVHAQIGDPPTGDFFGGFGKQLPALVSLADWKDGVFSGRFTGTIETPDAARVPHTIALELRLVDGVLRGQANAESGVDPVYFSLASYVEVRK